MSDGLTTAQLAERTGVRAATLRMWETRHGFPEPRPDGTGRRRFDALAVDAVLEVLRMRADGLSLPAAIERARPAAAPPAASIFAALRDARPELQPIVLPKRALLAVTRAIEDEYCARAGAGVLFASFQRVGFYRRSERRWREVARSAELAVALADFPAVRRPAHAPVEVPVAREQPLAREWTLVIDAPGARACLAAWELPATVVVPDRDRLYEVVWSYESEVVAMAAEIATRFVISAAPELARMLPERSALPAGNAAAELRFAAALAHRIVGYLTAAVSRDIRTPAA